VDDHAVDWTRTAASREKFILKRVRQRPIIFLIFDIPRGTLIEKRYGSGLEDPVVKKRPEWLSVEKKDFKVRPLDRGEKESVFDGDSQHSLSALPIYRETLKQVSITGGEIAEFSVFCHATASGPILVNTWEYQRIRAVNGVNTLVSTSEAHSSARDPNDFDFRARDFDGNAAQSPDDLRVWSRAFAPNGIAWIWGCNESPEIKVLFRAIKAGSPTVSRATKDAAKITVRLKDYQLQYIMSISKSLVTPSKKPGYYDIQFGVFRETIMRIMRGTFAQKFSNAIGRTVYSAAPGTAADYSPSNKIDMIIDSGSQEIVAFYKSIFGVSVDPQNIGYIAYKPM
jgi:hypothetical protein